MTTCSLLCSNLGVISRCKYSWRSAVLSDYLCLKRKPIGLRQSWWFLGLLIDTITQTVSVPVDKIEKVLNLINEVISKKEDYPQATAKNLWVLKFLGALLSSLVMHSHDIYTCTPRAVVNLSKATSPYKGEHGR